MSYALDGLVVVPLRMRAGVGLFDPLQKLHPVTKIQGLAEKLHQVGKLSAQTHSGQELVHLRVISQPLFSTTWIVRYIG